MKKRERVPECISLFFFSLRGVGGYAEATVKRVSDRMPATHVIDQNVF